MSGRAASIAASAALASSASPQIARSNSRSISSALADYEQQRNEAVMPMYESTCQRARLEPLPPELLALFRALRHNQHEADRFFGTDAGTVPIREFFAPENVERITRPAPFAVRAFDSAA